ncbi:general transcription factor II-I repeat domain-containing protein 2 [Trichonephila clavipes]|nr:general transcription factor II-I repeat domain-containing protein 2 [Trichonephila clavipes]
MVFDDFSTKEEFLKILPLTARTQGKDIFSLFKKFAIENKLSLQKLSSIITDGARATTGKENGFIGLCRKDPLFPKFIAYHCLINQEMLFTKTINFNHIMSIVTKIINSIKAKATQHRLFKLFLENENIEFKDLLLHTEVRWLTRGKVLERFINLLPQVKEFFASRNEVYELENKNWLSDLEFLVDITMKFNELNLKLQGKNSHIADMISAVNSFKCKLELLKAHSLKNSMSHFQNVKRIIENLNLSVDEFDTTSYIKTIDTLIIEFSSRYQDFLPLESVIPFFVNPFNVHEPDLPSKISNYFDVTNMQDLEMEITNLQNHIVLKPHYVDKSIWKLVTEESFPILRKCALKIFSYCGTTYKCEALFSNTLLDNC